MKSLRDEWSFVASGKFVISALITPLIVALIFGYIFSNNQINENKIAVIDEDHSLYSQQLINRMNSSQYIEVTDVFYHPIKPDYFFYNEKYVGVLYLPQGLEQNRFNGKQSNIGFYVDFINPASSADLRLGVSEVVGAENLANAKGKLKVKGMNDVQADGLTANLALHMRYLYNPTTDFINLTVIGFVNVVALSILTMQTSGIVPRLRVQGKYPVELNNPFGLISRVLPYSLTIMTSLFFAMGILKVVGGLRFVGNPFSFLLPLFLYTFLSGLIGMFLGLTAANSVQAMVRAGGLVLTSFLLSGIQAPLGLFPQSIRMISDMLPLTWHLRLTRGIGLRGGSINYFWSEIAVMTLMLAVILTLIFLVVILEDKKLKKTALLLAPNQETAL